MDFKRKQVSSTTQAALSSSRRLRRNLRTHPQSLSSCFFCLLCCQGIRHEAAPLIVGLLVSLVGGVLCLLLHMLSIAAILGWTAGAIIIIVSRSETMAMREDGRAERARRVACDRWD